jgi:hypothetical protein
MAESKNHSPFEGDFASLLPFIVGSWRKGPDIVQVCIQLYKGRPVLDMRVYSPAGKKCYPTKIGLTLLVGDLPQLENAVVKARHLAEELGFLTKGKKS